MNEPAPTSPPAPVPAPKSPADIERYLRMERAHYARLVAQSNFSSETFTLGNFEEHVVGSYAAHEAYDYERWLFGGMAIPASAIALDYGCGPGRMLRRLAPFFARIDGIDISPEVLAVARQRCETLSSPPRLYVTAGDSVPGELADTYDIAYSVICLQHICVHSIRYRIFQGLFRALKPGGILTFQMGYGPGHANMADYEIDYVNAEATNGAVDVGVLHPASIGTDLEQIGFRGLVYALTPTGPGDQHGAWIFVRAIKPGHPAAPQISEPTRWQAHGFAQLLADDAAARRARALQREHGVVARRRNLHKRIQELEGRIADLQSQITEQKETR